MRDSVLCSLNPWSLPFFSAFVLFPSLQASLQSLYVNGSWIPAAVFSSLQVTNSLTPSLNYPPGPTLRVLVFNQLVSIWDCSA